MLYLKEMIVGIRHCFSVIANTPSMHVYCIMIGTVPFKHGLKFMPTHTLFIREMITFFEFRYDND